MFEKTSFPKKNNLGFLKEFKRFQIDRVLQIEERKRRDFIKRIKDGKFLKP